MKKKALLSVALIMALVMIVSACTPAAETPPPVEAPADATPPVEAPADDPAPPAETPAEEPPPEAATIDYSGVPVIRDDPFFPDGAIFYRDLRNSVWGETPVPNREVTIGYIVKTLENSFWQEIQAGVLDEAQRLNDMGAQVTIDFAAALTEADQEGQLAIMMDMINKGHDIIIMHAITDANMQPGVEAAIAAGIPVIAAGAPYESADYFWGVSEWNAGYVAGQMTAELLGDEGGEVTIISGIAINAAARARTESFQQAIEDAGNPNLVVVDQQNADWDRARARDIVDTQLIRFPELRAIFANNDTMAMGAVESVIAAGRLDDIIIGGVDATEEAIISMNAGELTFSIAPFPNLYGRIGIDMALRLLSGQNLPDYDIISEYIFVDSVNVNRSDREIMNWLDINYVIQ